MKNLNKLFISALSLSLFTLCTTPMYATSETKKDESVYVILDNNGDVKDITVSEWLHNDNGFSDYQDYTELEDVKYLNKDEKLSVNDNKINFNTDDKDIYYEGKINKELPLELDIKYYLNDVLTKAQDLSDKNGHLKIEIKLKDKLINNQILPLILMTNLDVEEFSNVKVDHGSVISDGKNQMIMMVNILGLDNITNDIDLVDLKEYLNDTFTIECDAKNITVPSIMAVSAMNNDIDLKEFNIDTSAYKNDLNKLKDATNEILNGTSKLKDANNTFDSKMNEFKNSVVTFNDGTKSLNDNTKKIKDGMNTLNTGINKVVSSLNELNSIISVIGDDEKTELVNTLQTLLKQMNNIPSELDKMSKVLEDEKTKLSKMDEVIINSIKDEELNKAYSEYTNLIINGLDKTIANSIDNVSFNPLLFINNEKLNTLIPILIEKGVVNSKEEAMVLIQGLINSDAINKVKNDLKNNISNGLNSDDQNSIKNMMVMGGVKISKTLINNIALGVKNNMNHELESMNSLLNQAQSSFDTLSNNINKVNGIIAKVDIDSLLNIVQGLESNKAELQTLSLGSQKINDSLNKLYEGTQTINEASNKILDATNEFTKATAKLKDSTSKLDEGVIKFSKEGIDVLNEKLNNVFNDVDKIQNKLKEITNKDNMYSNFAGINKDTSANVKFILKTQEIVKPDKIKNETNDNIKEDTSFWQRIVNLF